MRPRWLAALVVMIGMGLVSACAWEQGDAAADSDGPTTGASDLGPADGEDLPPTDLERVAVGTVAPDFTLASYSGQPISLSDYRGGDVVLVFYRGHW